MPKTSYYQDGAILRKPPPEEGMLWKPSACEDAWKTPAGLVVTSVAILKHNKTHDGTPQHATPPEDNMLNDTSPDGGTAARKCRTTHCSCSATV